MLYWELRRVCTLPPKPPGPRASVRPPSAPDGGDGLAAGVKLAGIIPAPARTRVNAALHEKGIEFDLNQIKPENLEELINQLKDFTVDIDDANNKVQVFCK